MPGDPLIYRGRLEAIHQIRMASCWLRDNTGDRFEVKVAFAIERLVICLDAEGVYCKATAEALEELAMDIRSR